MGVKNLSSINTQQFKKRIQRFAFRNGKTTHVPITTLEEPQPVYLSGNNLTHPTGSSGNLVFQDSENLTVECMGANNKLTIVCKSSKFYSTTGWLPKSTAIHFNKIKCAMNIKSVEKLGKNCASVEACFKQSTLEALYVEYNLNMENNIITIVKRPNFDQHGWYPRLNVNKLYSIKTQLSTFTTLIGATQAKKYLTRTSFLNRGHLAAKSDFVFAPSQRATFTFINVAPQWGSFNSGNWQTLEKNLKKHISYSKINTRIYTGTWDILKLKDGAGKLQNIYLSPTKKIPVPLWFYKVVHEPSTNRATAYLGMNNPHLTLAEAKSMAFCTDVCNGNSQFSWLNWKPDNMGLGFSICCDVNDFRKTVNHLPSFTVSGFSKWVKISLSITIKLQPDSDPNHSLLFYLIGEI
ncbi:salivary endonuclease-like [Arctopsyche grandis]|uniref:salivary endonuclease-like n=1 Tax=Arctopsyche grandis TaxID=121162 RepID=UPI00406DA316